MVESIGIDKAYKALDEAQLVLAVFDNNKPLQKQDREILEKAKSKPAVAVINKVDLEQRLETDEIENAFAKVVYICAKENKGLKELSSAVEELLGVQDFDTGAPILANLRQRQNCQNAKENIAEAIGGVEMGVTYDAVNVMVDSAVEELLSLTGKKATTEVVNNIFSKFCVGK